ncbi:MAG: hypothetical protein LBU42_08280 [Prevotellaceae bacterium]|jgi:uncharacterized protein (TIGR02145 family)|nr:hypothetical protein [Prevotellaceae bacterium]
MKKIFFLLTMLASVAASATVTVTPLTTDYVNGKVTFSVSWTGAPANNRVWVWVDLSPGTNISPGTFAKAVISAASATAGSILTVSDNTRGFYVTVNPSTVTATLGNAPNAPEQFSWCAYGSDYPPNFTYVDGVFILKGTPPFEIKAANGNTQTTSKTTLPVPELALIPHSMTDETGCPGVVKYPGCNLNSLNLGTVSFSSSAIYKIGAQTWSSPVVATNCNKSAYNGGSAGDYAADCRNNPGYSGHLFSVCAVIRYAAQLCPGEWRVPTVSELSALWTAAGAPLCNSNIETCNKPAALTYLQNNWALELSGMVLPNGSLFNTGANACYISSTADHGKDWWGIIFGLGNWYYNPWNGGGTDESGTTLRCIK